MPISFAEQQRLGEQLGYDTTPDEYTPATPPPYEPNDQQIVEAQEKAEAEQPDAGFWELFGKGFQRDNSVGVMLDHMNTPDFYYDQNFDIEETTKTNAERLDALGPNADQEEVGAILGTSLNLNHYEFLLGQLEKQKEDEEAFMAAGWKGFAARGLSGILDPVDAVVALVAAPIGAGVKLTRVGSALRGALAAGVSNATIEAYAAANNPYRDGTDVAFALAAGMALGGPLAGLTAPSNKRLRQLADDMNKAEQERAAVQTVADVVAQTDEKAAGKILDDAAEAEALAAAKRDVDHAELMLRDEGIDAMSYRELQTLAKSLGIKASGKADDLRAAIHEVNATNDKVTGADRTLEEMGDSHRESVQALNDFIDEPAASVDSDMGKILFEGKRRWNDGNPRGEGDDIGDSMLVKQNKLKELQALANTLGLSKAGTKVQIAQRLLDHADEFGDTRALGGQAGHAGAARRVIEDPDVDAPGGALDVAPSARATAEELGEDLDEPGDFRFGWAQKLQGNYLGRLFHGTSKTGKKFASNILEGGLLVDKKATRGFTAEGRMNNLHQTATAKMFHETKGDFDAWSKENGYGTLRREAGTEANEKFFTEVGAALRGLDDVDGVKVTGHAKSAARKIRAQLDEFHALAKEVGLPGFIDSDPIENFFPRTWEQSKMAGVFEKVDDKNLVQWFKEALTNKFDELDDATEEIAERIARGFVKGLRRNHEGLDQALQHGIPLEDADRLRELFDGFDEDQIDDIIERVTRMREAQTGDAGNIKHGRNRLRFDETFQAPLRTKDGGTMSMSIDKMTYSDAGKMIPRYFRTMSGWIGLAKEANIRSHADVDAILKTMATEGADAAEQKAFKEAITLVTGHSVEDNPHSGISRLSRLNASWGYTRFGGSFGVAQIPELGNIIGEVGIVNFIRHMPEYRSILRRVEGGKLDNELAAELEALVAAGTDYGLGGARSNFDEHGLAIGDKMKKIDAMLARGGRMTSIMSLMGPITTALERIATFDIAKDWGFFARGTKNLTAAKRSRLRAAGLSDEMQERIFAEMRTHSKFEGDSLQRLNTEKWTDLEALDSYRMGLDRQRRYTIQRNDIGNTGKYIHNPLGRTLTQFMNFMLNSINKQLLKGVHHADIQTFVSFSTSMFLGSMAYIAQTQIDYAGNDKKRKERLTPKRIAAAAYSRAGFAAITIPFIDSSLALAGQDQLFNYGRTSGLGTDFITGNTTFTTVNDVAQTATLPLRLLLNDDYRFSQADHQRLQRLIPFQRTLGVKNAFHAIDDSFNIPKQSTSQ